MNIETGTILQNRYRIVKQFDANSYRAWDTALEQPRILQIVPSDGARPKQLAQLHHTHLPRVSDVLVIDGTRLLVIDYVDGQSVSERVMERGRPVEVARARHWATQVGAALRYLHQQGMTHGAVSADSILITPTQDAMLTGYAADARPQNEDVRGLAAALYTMITARPVSQTPPKQHNSKLTSVLSAAIMNGIAGKYSTVDDLLTALDQQPEPAAARPAPPLGDKTTPLFVDPPFADEDDKTTLLNVGAAPADDKTTPFDSASQAPMPIAPPRPPKSTTSSKKKSSKLPFIIGGLLAVFLGLAVVFGLFGGGEDDDPTDAEEPTAEVADAAVPTDQPAAPTDSVNEPTVIPTAAPLSGGDDDPDPTPVPEADDPEPTTASDDTDTTAPPVATVGDAQFQQLFSGSSDFSEGTIGTLGSLAFDEASGALYVADSLGGLLVINPATGETQALDLGIPVVTTIDFVNIIDSTTLMLFSATASMGFFVDIANQQLQGSFGEDGTAENQLNLVKYVVNDAAGTLYILDTAPNADGGFDNFIKVYAADGTFQRAMLIDSFANNALAIDTDGNLYATTFNSILKYDNDGNLLTEIETDLVASATTMTIAPDGSLVLLTRDEGLLILDPQGGLVAQLGEAPDDCADANSLNAGQICRPEGVITSSDGTFIFYTDNTFNFGSVNAVQLQR